jgi:ATP-dependent DNA ligase
MPKKKIRASFIEPMLLLRTEKLPEGPDWLFELKLDGDRALAIKSGGKVQLRSRNDNNFNSRYPGMVAAWDYVDSGIYLELVATAAIPITEY